MEDPWRRESSGNGTEAIRFTVRSNIVEAQREGGSLHIRLQRRDTGEVVKDLLFQSPGEAESLQCGLDDLSHRLVLEVLVGAGLPIRRNDNRRPESFQHFDEAPDEGLFPAPGADHFIRRNLVRFGVVGSIGQPPADVHLRTEHRQGPGGLHHADLGQRAACESAGGVDVTDLSLRV